MNTLNVVVSLWLLIWLCYRFLHIYTFVQQSSQYDFFNYIATKWSKLIKIHGNLFFSPFSICIFSKAFSSFLRFPSVNYKIDTILEIFWFVAIYVIYYIIFYIIHWSYFFQLICFIYNFWNDANKIVYM